MPQILLVNGEGLLALHLLGRTTTEVESQGMLILPQHESSYDLSTYQLLKSFDDCFSVRNEALRILVGHSANVCSGIRGNGDCKFFGRYFGWIDFSEGRITVRL